MWHFSHLKCLDHLVSLLFTHHFIFCHGFILFIMEQNWFLLCPLPLNQGWLKSTRNSYLNTGFFPRNLIWICGVLKKSIFAYLKFDICIPSKFSGILRFFYCSLHLTSIQFAPLPYLWLNLHFSWLGNNSLKWTWKTLTYPCCAVSNPIQVCVIAEIHHPQRWRSSLRMGLNKSCIECHQCAAKTQWFCC